MNSILVDIMKSYDFSILESMKSHPRILGEIFCHDIFSRFYLYLRNEEKEIALEKLKNEALMFAKEEENLPSLIKENSESLQAFHEKLKEYQNGKLNDSLEAYYLKEVEGVFEP